MDVMLVGVGWAMSNSVASFLSNRSNVLTYTDDALGPQAPPEASTHEIEMG